MLVDQPADEGAERAVRGGLGDQPEDDAAGIISALLVPLLGAGDAVPGAEADAIVDRLLQLGAAVISGIDLGDDAEGEQIGAALGDPAGRAQYW